MLVSGEHEKFDKARAATKKKRRKRRTQKFRGGRENLECKVTNPQKKTRIERQRKVNFRSHTVKITTAPPSNKKTNKQTKNIAAITLTTPITKKIIMLSKFFKKSAATNLSSLVFLSFV